MGLLDRRCEMINVWILTMVLLGYDSKSITSFQLKFDSVAKCESYNKYISSQYNSMRYISVVKGICVQTQEQKK